MFTITAIETGCPYSINVGQLHAIFNVPTDQNFCGYVDDITGLDFYEIRENAANLPAGDGGYHGPFWRGRRPWTLSGFVMPTTPVIARSAAQDKIAAVAGYAMRSDAQLLWTPSDGVQRLVNFRTQQPLRFPKGQSNVQRRFQIAGVCRDWRILTNILKTQSATGGSPSILCTNNGTADASPIITVTGPCSNPIITNQTEGGRLQFLAGSVAAGNQLVIDLTGTYPTVTYLGSDWSNNVDPLNTNWNIAIGPSNIYPTNNFTLSGGGMSSSSGLTISWRDSWH